MFMPPSPRFTFNPQQQPQYQAGANTRPPQPISNPMQNPQTGEIMGMNPMQAQLVGQQVDKFAGRYDQMDKNDTAAQNAGAAPLGFGQQVGGMLGFNNFAGKGGAADIVRSAQGIGGDTQGPPMPMDMFEQLKGSAKDGQLGIAPAMVAGGDFFPSWMTSLFS